MNLEGFVDTWKENVIITEKGDRIYYKCKKGLWGVGGHKDDKQRILQEAFHYFHQYLADGEYS